MTVHNTMTGYRTDGSALSARALHKAESRRNVKSANEQATRQSVRDAEKIEPYFNNHGIHIHHHIRHKRPSLHFAPVSLMGVI